MKYKVGDEFYIIGRLSDAFLKNCNLPRRKFIISEIIEGNVCFNYKCYIINKKDLKDVILLKYEKILKTRIWENLNV